MLAGCCGAVEGVRIAARCQALRLAARALEQRLNADTSDYTGPELPCSRGELAARDVFAHARRSVRWNEPPRRWAPRCGRRMQLCGTDRRSGADDVLGDGRHWCPDAQV